MQRWQNEMYHLRLQILRGEVTFFICSAVKIKAPCRQKTRTAGKVLNKNLLFLDALVFSFSWSFVFFLHTGDLSNMAHPHL